MTKRNELLNQAIESSIKKARYVEPKKIKKKKSVFYTVVVWLVSIAVLLSLLRYLSH